MSQRFEGRIALVTGGTRGIGAGVVRRFVQEGAQVVFCGLDASEGRPLAAELGDRARFVQADLLNPAECHAAVDDTLASFGRLDILVNNAATVARGTLEDTTIEQWDTVMNLNLRAPFLLMQRALPAFKAQHAREGVGGVVINTGSVNAYIGISRLMAYSASKGGLMTLSRNLANALAPWRVRVHVLNVGWTWTEGEDIVQRQQGAPADWAEQAGAQAPSGRLLNAADIAAAITFFASDEAAMFSGAAIDLEQFPVGRLAHSGL